MTRTAKYKLIYFAILGLSIFVGLGAVFLLRDLPFPYRLAWIVPVIVGLIPGRIQGHYWRDMLAGLYHLKRHNYATSKLHSERFLIQLQKRPWLKNLIWLGPSSYSRNVEAMTRNNLGAAMQNLGEIDGAKEQLDHAIALDPECPLPYRNMGILLLYSATTAQARPWLEKAKALGLTGDWSDRMISASQHRHAARSTIDKAAKDETAPVTPEPEIDGAFVVELINDDQTPFEFAVACLEETFGLTGIQAIRIAALVSREGRAPCAGFDTEAAAQAKADQLTDLVRRSDFPLACAVRRAESENE